MRGLERTLPERTLFELNFLSTPQVLIPLLAIGLEIIRLILGVTQLALSTSFLTTFKVY
jgi:hypothetical protein